MIYVERNEKGKIISLRRDTERPGMECKFSVDREILDFLGGTEESHGQLQLLAVTDAAMARIVEDLVELLARKNVIMLTELPEEAQQTLQLRVKTRRQVGRETIIVDEIL